MPISVPLVLAAPVRAELEAITRSTRSPAGLARCTRPAGLRVERVIASNSARTGAARTSGTEMGMPQDTTRHLLAQLQRQSTSPVLRRSHNMYATSDPLVG